MKTNQTIRSSFITLLFSLGFAHAEPEFSINEVNVKIDALVQERVHLTTTPLSVGERSIHEDFVALKAFCEDHWVQMIQNLDQVNHGNIGKGLVIEALQVLDATDFMTAFEALVAKLEAGTLDSDLVTTAMSFNMLKMRGFFPDNYQHPRVVAALNKIKAKAANDQKLVERIDRILSGEAKAMLDETREAYEGMPEGDIPIILIPPSE
jgi:hypothetical protein